MRCFACDRSLSNPQPDPPTGRYYCDQCIQPTIEEQLRLQGKDYIPQDFDTEEVPPLFEENKETDYDTYF
jgi:hypothetical protein